MQVAEAQAYTQRKKAELARRMRKLEEEATLAEFVVNSQAPADGTDSESESEEQLQLITIPQQETQLVVAAKTAAQDMYPTTGFRARHRQHKEDTASFQDGRDVAKKRKLTGEMPSIC